MPCPINCSPNSIWFLNRSLATNFLHQIQPPSLQPKKFGLLFVRLVDSTFQMSRSQSIFHSINFSIVNFSTAARDIYNTRVSSLVSLVVSNSVILKYMWRKNKWITIVQIRKLGGDKFGIYIRIFKIWRSDPNFSKKSLTLQGQASYQHKKIGKDS